MAYVVILVMTFPNDAAVQIFVNTFNSSKQRLKLIKVLGTTIVLLHHLPPFCDSQSPFAASPNVITPYHWAVPFAAKKELEGEVGGVHPFNLPWVYGVVWTC